MLGNKNCGLGTEWIQPGQWKTVNEMRIATLECGIVYKHMLITA
jgi:hypothetical protein